MEDAFDELKQPVPRDEPPSIGVTRAEGLFDTARQRQAAAPLPPPDELQRSFPQYEILALVGRGGMGAVYKARQKALDRLVALKLLSPEFSGDEEFTARFELEARAMARLSHPNIVTVHDFGQTAEGRLYLAMEFVDGTDLHDIIGAGEMDGPTALGIAAQICEALACAHGENIVHRDIKPTNIMLDCRGRVKVADFGLARLVEPGSEISGLTTVGNIMGTLDYMAPEQRRGMNVDHRADIYSLGVVLYEMLCREVPHGVFEVPSVRVGCDPRIDAIVTRALQREPERRYQRTQEMKSDIETMPAAPAASGSLPAWTRFMKGVALVIVGMVLATGVLTLLAIRGAPPAPDLPDLDPEPPALKPVPSSADAVRASLEAAREVLQKSSLAETKEPAWKTLVSTTFDDSSPFTVGTSPTWSATLGGGFWRVRRTDSGSLWLGASNSSTANPIRIKTIARISDHGIFARLASSACWSAGVRRNRKGSYKSRFARRRLLAVRRNERRRHANHQGLDFRARRPP